MYVTRSCAPLVAASGATERKTSAKAVSHSLWLSDVYVHYSERSVQTCCSWITVHHRTIVRIIKIIVFKGKTRLGSYNFVEIDNVKLKTSAMSSPSVYTVARIRSSILHYIACAAAIRFASRGILVRTYAHIQYSKLTYIYLCVRARMYV